MVSVKETIQQVRNLAAYYVGEDYVVSDLLKKSLILANAIDPVKDLIVETNPTDFELIKDYYSDVGYHFQSFSIRSGKAKYHYLTLADKSIGIYYGFREMKGSLGAKRALKPRDLIKVHFSLCC